MRENERDGQQLGCGVTGKARWWQGRPNKHSAQRAEDDDDQLSMGPQGS